MTRKRSRYRPRNAAPNGWAENRLLSTEPWRINASLDPLIKILDQIEHAGTIDTARGEAVFRDTGSKAYYSAVPALRGVVDMFEIAATRKSWKLDLAPITRLGNKLDVGCPIMQNDIDSARRAIESIRLHAMRLTLGEANDLLNTWRIREALHKSGATA